MLDRNEQREILINENKLYKKMLKDRGLNRFRHYSKMKLNSMSPSDMKDITIADHIYKTGDSLSKLSHKYYGDVRYWWIIAWFNKKPTESHVRLGDIIHIPMPLATVLYHYSVG